MDRHETNSLVTTPDALPPTEQVESEPNAYEAVENFLWEHAPLFEESIACWQRVREAQGAMSSAMEDGKGHMMDISRQIATSVSSPGNTLSPLDRRQGSRKIDRVTDKVSRHFIQMANHSAYAFYIETVAPHINELTPEELEDCVKTHYERMRRQPDPAYSSMREFVKATGQEVPAETDTNDSDAAFSACYLQAFITEGQITAKLNELFKDTRTIAPFMERTIEISQNAIAGFTEFPGFLESVALSVKLSQENSKLQAGITESIDQQAGWQKLLESALEGEDIGGELASKRRELSCIVAAMQWVAETVEADFGISKAVLAARLREHIEGVPAELSMIASSRVRSQTESLWKAFKTSLKPFERQARMPATAESDFLQEAMAAFPSMPTHIKQQLMRMSPDARALLGPGSGKGKRKRTNPQSQAQAVDVRDITQPEQEKQPPIFAVLKRTARNSVFSVSKIGTSIDEVMEHPLIKDFIDNQRQEARFSDNVRAYLEGIANNSTGRQTTALEKGKRYSLEEAAAKRPLLRFSAQRFPTEGKGIMASRTRIVYATRNIDGQPYVLLQDISLASE